MSSPISITTTSPLTPLCDSRVTPQRKLTSEDRISIVASTACNRNDAGSRITTPHNWHLRVRKKEKVKEGDIYIAPLLKYLIPKVLRYGSHSVTCKLHRTCLYLVSIHQMAHPRLRLRPSNCSLLLIHLPRRMKG